MRVRRVSASVSRTRRSSSGWAIAAATTRSPIAAIVSATVRTRASSAASRKNGRRNGHSGRPPNVSRASRIRAETSAQ